MSVNLLSPYFLKDILSFYSLKISPSFPCSYPVNICVGLILHVHSWLFSSCPPNQRNPGWPVVPPAFQVVLVVKNPPASAGAVRDAVPSLGGDDPLEKETAPHFSILAWRIPWTEEPGGL